MSTPDGRIELERTVDSITVGRRHRTDLGDLDALAASIEREDLLQPPTITPDGTLVCGARRLAAIKQLGHRRVSVWVRSGISDRLGHLLAEQDDNQLHKSLTPIEAAGLYREIKELIAEDAARRKAATQFQDGHEPGKHGPADSAGPPAPGPLGDARAQAARMVTGSLSYTRLEQIGFLQRLTDDPSVSEALRGQARDGLARIEAGAPVIPILQRLRDAHSDTGAERDRRLHELADEALARVHTTRRGKAPKRAVSEARPADGDAGPARFSVRAFVLTWGGLDAWWTHYDVDELATDLTDEQIEVFFAAVEGTMAFADRLRTARTATQPDQPLLRAL
ncbi:chromosome partitioning protein ParB [Janibacter hoylei PVAS-1]|uniref:Chromosome partitioning protein ParB n=1 Tax=Janibacter hoylei PVAS-1 TaxID=1210046 RepID=A0A444B5D2_9MICO|nr:ParB N-terminal domain-containing protein [Janibacter hoylei]RWU83610.1 chromosome partitioning protein ParB [Janibacter hoylei PVAS-1]